MRLIDKASVPVILIAGGMVYLSERFQLPILIPSALGIFGLFDLWLGTDTFVRGEFQLFNRQHSRRENFPGIPARLLGIVIFTFGAGVSIYAASEFFRPGAAGEFLAGLVQSPRGWGAILLIFGFFSLLFGLVRFIAGSAHRKEERQVGVDLGYRDGGFMSTIFGLLLLAVGAWLFIQLGG